MLAASCFLDVTRGLWTPDEPREAGISREMYAGARVIPTLNGEPFIEKPPLYYWITACAFHVAGGPKAAVARAISAISGLAALAVVFVWVSRARSFEAAAFTTVLLSTCAGFVTSAHWVRMDAVLLLFCTLAVWSAWERVGRSGGPWFLSLFYAALVLALWTKGLVGPVLVIAGLAAYAALSRSVTVLAPLRPVVGVVVLAAATTTLAAAILAAGGRSALHTWLWVNHLQRLVHPVTTGHEEPFTYYATALPLAIAPWLVPFFALFRPRAVMWRRDRADATLLRYALGMTLGPLLVLTAASSKRGVYLVPLLPPLALMMASATLARIESERNEERPRRWTQAGDWLQASFLGLLGLAPAIAHLAATRSLTPISAIFLVAGLAMAGALVLSVARRDAARAFWIGAASIGLAMAGATALVVPRADAVKNFAPFIASIDAMLPRGEPVRAMGVDETLLGIVSFVTGRRVIPVEADGSDAPAFVLVQSRDGQPEPGQLEPAYERVAAREFGPGRRLSLWRRRPSDQATVTSSER